MYHNLLELVTSTAADDVESLPQDSSLAALVAAVKFVVNTWAILYESLDNLIAVWFNIATIATLKFTLSPYTMAIAIDPKMAKIYRAGTRPNRKKTILTFTFSNDKNKCQSSRRYFIHEFHTYCLFIG